MEKQSTVAELRFMAQNICLYGTVHQMNTKAITIRLQDVPAAPGLFEAETEVEVAVIAKNRTFTVAAKVAAARDDVLILAFAAPIRGAQRRKEQRLNCKLDVNFRPIQEDGCYGIWKHAFSRDVSYGGMCLIIAPGLEIPKKIEVLFMIPDQGAAGSLDMIACSEDSLEMLKMLAAQRLQVQRSPARARAIKATCCVTNKRQQSDGYFVLGLSFSVITPDDQIRLARYLSAQAVHCA